MNTKANEKLRYLLMQVRNPEDPMRMQEVRSFARALHCEVEQIEVLDLLSRVPERTELNRVDVVLLGGSGHYSAAGEGAWLERALDAMRELHDLAKPTFASCWGFQAMARATGGRVIKDLKNAEIGTVDLFLTNEGHDDPVFAPLGENFQGQAGHEDHVVELPLEATLLASSNRVTNQAYCFPGRPIYCTQFHPELSREDLLGRVQTYPEYVERIANIPAAEFIHRCRETLDAEALLSRFVRHVLGDG